MISDAMQLAAPLVEKWETFRATPYLCPANRWTIGYGTTRYPNGVPVKQDDPPCTPQEAESWMMAALGRIEDQVLGLVTRSISVHELGAMICLCYNIGVGIHDGIKGDFADSALLERFNQGSFMSAADQFLVWNKAHVDGQLVVLPGLTARRREERALFLG